MKKIILAAALFSFFVCSCAKDTIPRAVIVPQIAPKVEQVSVQAKATSIQAGKTTEVAKIIKDKYVFISPNVARDIESIEESAKLTEVESKKTEFQLEFLTAYAKDVDLKAIDLTKESQAKDQVIYQKEAKIKSAETEIIKKDAKISSRNGYLVGAGAIILVLGCLIIKPWKYLI